MTEKMDIWAEVNKMIQLRDEDGETEPEMVRRIWTILSAKMAAYIALSLEEMKALDNAGDMKCMVDALLGLNKLIGPDKTIPKSRDLKNSQKAITGFMEKKKKLD